tara:strand:- start:807 stop:1046 length:240 start_codon:yes stop_codon:yes gene_type:complete
MQKTSQQMKILKAFMKGKHLTFNSARSISGSNYPLKRISELKQEGIPIKDEWIENTDQARYKRYWIDKEDIKELKQERE